MATTYTASSGVPRHRSETLFMAASSLLNTKLIISHHRARQACVCESNETFMILFRVKLRRAHEDQNRGRVWSLRVSLRQL